MSKNVAVFVDVANIFYAAKAAGVDIDYVTLLKSATAGRDFVRAYAYTGLDPENENQRQFHSFLARSGYKVVSKDIRKYGDGRIKANLDIELVVDMMRMAEKLDIAVVVSGDGDFAPAIYAVQQQGVRVEVISFRGNTSSDLIDAADVFIDISNIARVEKGARSGRRVAAEGDLSMTEVPDKESGVTPRRRRRDGEERPERAERPERPTRRRGTPAAPVVDDERPALAGLVALPGEKLSRGMGPVDIPVTAEAGVAIEEDGDLRGSPLRGRSAAPPPPRWSWTRSRWPRARGHRRPACRGRTACRAGRRRDRFPRRGADPAAALSLRLGLGPPDRRALGSSRVGPRTAPQHRPSTTTSCPSPTCPSTSSPNGASRTGGARAAAAAAAVAVAIDRRSTGSVTESDRAQGSHEARGVAAKVAIRPRHPGRASAHAMAPIEQTPGGDPGARCRPRCRSSSAPSWPVGRQAQPPGRRRPGSPGPPRPRKPPPRPPARTWPPRRTRSELRGTTRRRTSRTATAPKADASPAPKADASPAPATEAPKPKRASRKPAADHAGRRAAAA